MRKRIVPGISVRQVLNAEEWLDLEGLVEVEVTSEHPAHPVEAALLPGTGDGWRAAAEGPQTIRLLFDSPQDLHHIHVVFTEEHQSRTQEFVIRAGSSPELLTEIVRQQYNFAEISSEVEEYRVDLPRTGVLELMITPDISGGGTASLTELRLR